MSSKLHLFTYQTLSQTAYQSRIWAPRYREGSDSQSASLIIGAVSERAMELGGMHDQITKEESAQRMWGLEAQIKQHFAQVRAESHQEAFQGFLETLRGNLDARV